MFEHILLPLEYKIQAYVNPLASCGILYEAHSTSCTYIFPNTDFLSYWLQMQIMDQNWVEIIFLLVTIRQLILHNIKRADTSLFCTPRTPHVLTPLWTGKSFSHFHRFQHIGCDVSCIYWHNGNIIIIIIIIIIITTIIIVRSYYMLPLN